MASLLDPTQDALLEEARQEGLAAREAQRQRLVARQAQITQSPGLNQDFDPQSEHNAFARGAHQGLLETGAGLQALAGVVGAQFGADEFATNRMNAARELSAEAQQVGPRIQDPLDQIENWSDVGSFVAGAAGQFFGGNLPLLLGGGLVGLAGRSLATKLALNAAMKLTGKQAFGAGALGGMYAANTGGLATNIATDPDLRADWEAGLRDKWKNNATLTGTVEQVIDGDTADVRLNDGRLRRFRLHGINTADELQEGKLEATKRLADLAAGKTVSIYDHGKDIHGRQVGSLYLPGQTESVGEQMLRTGAASTTAHGAQYDYLKKLQAEGVQQPGALPQYQTRFLAPAGQEGIQRIIDVGSRIPEAQAADKRRSLAEMGRIALAVGIPLTALDAVGVLAAAPVVRRALGRTVEKQVKDEFKRLALVEAAQVEKVAPGFWKSVSKGFVGGTVGEGFTEGLQTVVERAALNLIDERREVLGEEGIREVINSVFGGAAVGGLLGGGLSGPIEYAHGRARRARPPVAAPVEEPGFREQAQQLETAIDEGLSSAAAKMQAILRGATGEAAPSASAMEFASGPNYSGIERARKKLEDIEIRREMYALRPGVTETDLARFDVESEVDKYARFVDEYNAVEARLKEIDSDRDAAAWRDTLSESAAFDPSSQLQLLQEFDTYTGREQLRTRLAELQGETFLPPKARDEAIATRAKVQTAQTKLASLIRGLGPKSSAADYDLAVEVMTKYFPKVTESGGYVENLVRGKLAQEPTDEKLRRVVEAYPSYNIGRRINDLANRYKTDPTREDTRAEIGDLLRRMLTISKFETKLQATVQQANKAGSMVEKEFLDQGSRTGYNTRSEPLLAPDFIREMGGPQADILAQNQANVLSNLSKRAHIMSLHEAARGAAEQTYSGDPAAVQQELKNIAAKVYSENVYAPELAPEEQSALQTTQQAFQAQLGTLPSRDTKRPTLRAEFVRNGQELQDTTISPARQQQLTDRQQEIQSLVGNLGDSNSERPGLEQQRQAVEHKLRPPATGTITARRQEYKKQLAWFEKLRTKFEDEIPPLKNYPGDVDSIDYYASPNFVQLFKQAGTETSGAALAGAARWLRNRQIAMSVADEVAKQIQADPKALNRYVDEEGNVSPELLKQFVVSQKPDITGNEALGDLPLDIEKLKSDGVIIQVGGELNRTTGETIESKTSAKLQAQGFEAAYDQLKDKDLFIAAGVDPELDLPTTYLVNIPQLVHDTYTADKAERLSDTANQRESFTLAIGKQLLRVMAVLQASEYQMRFSETGTGSRARANTLRNIPDDRRVFSYENMVYTMGAVRAALEATYGSQKELSPTKKTKFDKLIAQLKDAKEAGDGARIAEINNDIDDLKRWGINKRDVATEKEISSGGPFAIHNVIWTADTRAWAKSVDTAYDDQIEIVKLAIEAATKAKDELNIVAHQETLEVLQEAKNGLRLLTDTTLTDAELKQAVTEKEPAFAAAEKAQFVNVTKGIIDDLGVVVSRENYSVPFDKVQDRYPVDYQRFTQLQAAHKAMQNEDAALSKAAKQAAKVVKQHKDAMDKLAFSDAGIRPLVNKILDKIKDPEAKKLLRSFWENYVDKRYFSEFVNQAFLKGLYEARNAAYNENNRKEIDRLNTEVHEKLREEARPFFHTAQRIYAKLFADEFDLGSIKIEPAALNTRDHFGRVAIEEGSKLDELMQKRVYGVVPDNLIIGLHGVYFEFNRPFVVDDAAWEFIAPTTRDEARKPPYDGYRHTVTRQKAYAQLLRTNYAPYQPGKTYIDATTYLELKRQNEVLRELVKQQEAVGEAAVATNEQLADAISPLQRLNKIGTFEDKETKETRTYGIQAIDRQSESGRSIKAEDRGAIVATVRKILATPEVVVTPEVRRYLHALARRIEADTTGKDYDGIQKLVVLQSALKLIQSERDTVSGQLLIFNPLYVNQIANIDGRTENVDAALRDKEAEIRMLEAAEQRAVAKLDIAKVAEQKTKEELEAAKTTEQAKQNSIKTTIYRERSETELEETAKNKADAERQAEKIKQYRALPEPTPDATVSKEQIKAYGKLANDVVHLQKLVYRYNLLRVLRGPDDTSVTKLGGEIANAISEYYQLTRSLAITKLVTAERLDTDLEASLLDKVDLEAKEAAKLEKQRQLDAAYRVATTMPPSIPLPARAPVAPLSRDSFLKSLRRYFSEFVNQTILEGLYEARNAAYKAGNRGEIDRLNAEVHKKLREEARPFFHTAQRIYAKLFADEFDLGSIKIEPAGANSREHFGQVIIEEGSELDELMQRRVYGVVPDNLIIGLPGVYFEFNRPFVVDDAAWEFVASTTRNEDRKPPYDEYRHKVTHQKAYAQLLRTDYAPYQPGKTYIDATTYLEELVKQQKAVDEAAVVEHVIATVPSSISLRTEPTAPAAQAAESFEIVHLPFEQKASPGVFNGHRAGSMNVTNAAPGEPGALGNPYISNDVPGGTYSREEAVRLFKQAFLKRVNEDPAYRDWVLSLRGGKVGYYKPTEASIHLHAVQKWLESQASAPAAQPTTGNYQAHFMQLDKPVVMERNTSYEQTRIERDQSAIDALIRAFGTNLLGLKVQRVSRQEILKLLDSANEGARAAAIRADRSLGVTLIKNGTAHIWLNENATTDVRYTALAHEFGHVIFEHNLASLPANIRAEFETWYTEQQKLNEGDRTHRNIAHMHLNQALREADKERALKEWFADNVAIYLQTSRTAETLVDHYFHNVAGQLKILWKWLVDNTGMKAAPSVAAFLDDLRAKAVERAVDTKDRTTWLNAIKQAISDKAQTDIDELFKEATGQNFQDFAHFVLHDLAGKDQDAKRTAFQLAYTYVLNDKEREAISRAFASTLMRKQVARLVGRPDIEHDIGRVVNEGFLLFADGRLTVGQTTYGIFGKILKLARKYLGIISAEERALDIFKFLHSAQVDAVAEKLQIPDINIARQAQERNNALQKFVAVTRTSLIEPVSNFMSRWISSQAYMKKVPWLQDIMNNAFYVSHDISRNQVGTYNEQKGMHLRKFVSQLQNIFTEDMDADFISRVSYHLRSGTDPTDPKQKKVVAEVRRWLSAMRGYALEAGVEIGHIPNYFPLVYDSAAIERNAKLFADAIVKYAPDEFYAQTRRYDYRDNRTVLKKPEGELEAVTAENKRAKAEAVVQAILNAHGYGDIDFQNPVSNRTPYFGAHEARSLGFLVGKPGIDAFLSKDLSNILTSYAAQTVKHAEYTRAFGRHGSVITKAIEKAKEMGATPWQMKQLEDGIAGQLGIYGADWTRAHPTLAKVQSWLITYTNFRILGLAQITNVGDLLGLAMSSKDTRAWARAVEASMADLYRQFKGQPNQLKTLVAALGVAEQGPAVDAMDWSMGTPYLTNTTQRANNWLFRWTGVEATTRFNRTVAARMARDFFTEEAKAGRVPRGYGLKRGDLVLDTDGNLDFSNVLNYSDVLREFEEFERSNIDTALARKDETAEQTAERQKESARKYNELRENLRRADRLSIAVNRYVNNGIMRPDASMRPIAGNDPRAMLIYYLRSYTFTFWDRFLRPIFNKLDGAIQAEGATGTVSVEARQAYGEMAKMAMLYIPTFFMIETLRDLIQHFGEGDPGKRAWSIWDHIWYAAIRAGITGPVEYGLQAVDSKSQGKLAFEPLLGPIVSWGVDVATALANPNKIDTTTMKSLPFQNIWRYELDAIDQMSK